MKFFIQSLTGETQTPATEQLVISGLTYPNSSGEAYSVLGNVMSATNSYQRSPVAWRVQDKSFMAITTEDSDLNKNYVIVYDHFRNAVSNPIYTGITADRGDVHHFANIINADNGKLITMQDIAHGGGAMDQATSSANYNVLGSWTVRSLNDTDSDNMVYPHTDRLSDGTLVDTRRDASTANRRGKLRVYNSTTANPWVYLGEMVDWSDANTTTSHVPYHGMIYGDDDVVRIWVGDSHATTGFSFLGWPYLFYMESADGGTTWRNVGNTFSKNIVTSGAITHAECVTNFTVIDNSAVTPVDEAYTRANGGCYDSDTGDIYIVTCYQKNVKPHVARWNGTTWSVNEISVSGKTMLNMVKGTDFFGNPLVFGASNNSTEIAIKSDGLYFYGCYQGQLVSDVYYGIVAEFKSTDNGVTWSWVRDLTDPLGNHGSVSIYSNHYNNPEDFFLSDALDNVNESRELYIGQL